MIDPSPPPVPRWLRVWAVLTALSALVPLALLGAETTTKGVGMVDPKGFRTPWHLFTIPSEERSLALLIEHNHRLVGWIVGFFCIVLAVGMTIQCRGRYRLLGWLALVAVGMQGLLGGFRVNLNALFGDSLRVIHGCFAQLVFATLVIVAILSSRLWWGVRREPTGKLGKMALGLCVLIYVQIVFGAMVRHQLDPLAQRLHVLLAFAIVGKIVWFAGKVREVDPATRRAVRFLLILVLIQPVLGIEAWMRRFGAGTLPELVPSSTLMDLSRTGHHLVGTFLFATSVALTMLLLRPAATMAPSQSPPRLLEGAA
jgi:heme A synthase